MRHALQYLWIGLGLGIVSGPLCAQEDGPLTSLQFNLVVQNTFQQSEEGTGPLGNDGMRVRRVRPRITGQALPTVRFTVQADMVRDYPLVDASITWTPVPTWDVMFGMYKVPFSMELLENVGRLDFVMRSRIVRNFVPGRDTGLSVRTSLGKLSVQAGAFNGVGGRTFTNDNASYMYAGRLSLDLGSGETRFRMGANAAYSQDAAASVRGLSSSFDGTRALLGGDVWLDLYAWTLKSELIYVDTDKQTLGKSGAFSGGYVTLIRRFGEDWAAAARWDRYVDVSPSDDLIAGITWGPRAPVKMQANAHIPLNHTNDRFPAFVMLVQIML